jgi:hypothetical protein
MGVKRLSCTQFTSDFERGKPILTHSQGKSGSLELNAKIERKTDEN